ncbi:MAG: FMN-binding protein, partial [Acholeplasmataceae bacterium]
MKNSLSLVLFVLIMGVVSSLVLTGANLITADRIAKNAELTWKSAILSHHEVSFNQTNFAEVFDETFEVETRVNPANDKELYLYTNLETGRSSFRFEGNGLWDKILGVITLEEDFYTIKAISVTEQGETPGLGGIVAEKPYLAKYVGKKFGESSGLVVVKNSSSADNEVDMITGATGTSTAFANLLNQQHRLYLSLFKGVDPDALWMREILSHNEIESTKDDYASLFDEFIDVMTEDDLDLYFHKTNGNISFKFEDTGYEGKTLKGVVTIKEDWITIVGVSIYEQEEQRGAATLAKPEVLGAFIGKKFDPTIVMSKNPNADNEVLDLFLYDDGTGVTFTKDGVVNGLNNAYIQYYQTFKDKDFNPVDKTMPWKIAMLKNHDIDVNENNYTELFKNYFIEESKDDLTLYLGQDTRTINILFEIDGFS